MERRYDLLAEVGMRDITGYNVGFDDGDLADYEEAYQLRMRGTGSDDEDGTMRRSNPAISGFRSSSSSWTSSTT